MNHRWLLVLLLLVIGCTEVVIDRRDWEDCNQFCPDGVRIYASAGVIRCQCLFGHGKFDLVEMRKLRAACGDTE